MLLLGGASQESIWNGEDLPRSWLSSFLYVVDFCPRKDCSAQVLNFNGAKYKKFLDAAEAELWINANAGGPLAGRQSTTTAVRTEATTASAEERVTADEAKSIARQSEAVAVTSAHASNRSSAPRMETAASVPAQRAVPPPPQEIRTTVSSFASGTSGSASSGPMVVYTDGSCRGNGKPGSTAGVGVWWGVDDPRYVHYIHSSPSPLTSIPLGHV